MKKPTRKLPARNVPMVCANCGKRYKAKKQTPIGYCRPTCKVLAHRLRHAEPMEDIKVRVDRIFDPVGNRVGLKAIVEMTPAGAKTAAKAAAAEGKTLEEYVVDMAENARFAKARELGLLPL